MIFNVLAVSFQYSLFLIFGKLPAKKFAYYVLIIIFYVAYV